MSEHDLRAAADLPSWMKTLRDRYIQTDTGQFILYGNVHDLLLCADQPFSLPDFLDQYFSLSGKTIIHYDPGRGVYCPNEAQTVQMAQALIQNGMIPQAKIAPHGLDKTPPSMIARNVERELSAERNPEVALEVIESLLLYPGITCAVIIHYADLVAP